MNWEMIYYILSGLAVCIPLVIKLADTIAKHTKEKNWAALIEYVLSYMVEAERLFSDGAERKEYVMQLVEESAKFINYNYDEEAKEKVSDMIDIICQASKTINAGTEN